MFLIFCPWSETHLREAVVAGGAWCLAWLARERTGWDRICWSLSKMDMWWRLQTFILASTGPRINHRTQPRSGSKSCLTRLINNLIAAPPRFAPHCSTAAMAAGNNCESGSDGAAVNWFLIISRNSLESHEFLECHLSVIWWFVESSWSVVGLSALTLLICVDAVGNQNRGYDKHYR